MAGRRAGRFVIRCSGAGILQTRARPHLAARCDAERGQIPDSLTPEGSQRLAGGRRAAGAPPVSAHHPNSPSTPEGSQRCDPSRVMDDKTRRTGGVGLGLNHRLMAAIPPGWNRRDRRMVRWPDVHRAPSLSRCRAPKIGARILARSERNVASGHRGPIRWGEEIRSFEKLCHGNPAPPRITEHTVRFVA